MNWLYDKEMKKSAQFSVVPDQNADRIFDFIRRTSPSLSEDEITEILIRTGFNPKFRRQFTKDEIISLTSRLKNEHDSFHILKNIPLYLAVLRRHEENCLLSIKELNVTSREDILSEIGDWRSGQTYSVRLFPGLPLPAGTIYCGSEQMIAEAPAISTEEAFEIGTSLSLGGGLTLGKDGRGRGGILYPIMDKNK